MPQMLLPIFPDGCTEIGSGLTFGKKDGQVTYFLGVLPVFTHDEDDIRSFRMITSQFCESGIVKQVDIVKAFGVPAVSVKRAVKLYQEKGVSGFFKARRPRGPAVLTPPVLAEAQEKLDESLSPSEVADQLGVKCNTLAKAIRAGRLHQPKKNGQSPRQCGRPSCQYEE